MSINYHFYIGVYVECVNPVKQVKVQTYVCLNVKCSYRFQHAEQQPVCPVCGHDNTEYDIVTREEPTVNWFEVSEAIHEKLFPAVLGGVDIWLPNVMDKTGIGINLPDEGEGGYRAIAPEQIRAHLSTFDVDYAEAVLALLRYYGEDCVKVRWGVVTYYN